MPSTLHLTSGDTLDVQDSVPDAKKKKLAGGWQNFVTTLGNPCRVSCANIEKVTPVRA